MPDLSHVMPNPVVVPILWGHDYVQYPDTSKYVEQLVSDIVTGPFMNGMAQYGVRRGRLQPTVIIDDTAPPATIVYTNQQNQLVDQVTQKLISWIDAKLVPAPPGPKDDNWMYLIIPPSQTTPEMYNGAGDPIGNGAQAWHNEGVTNPGPPPVYYWAIVKTNDCGPPSAGQAFVNNFAQKTCHELAEQFVDRNGTFKEIGDPCNNVGDTYRGWSVQKYWSIWDNGCISGYLPPMMPRGFQTVDDYAHIFVLGVDGNLWFSRPPFGTAPPARDQVDANVFTFQVLDNDQVFVLGTDGKLWFEPPFGPKVPPARTQIDENVKAFYAPNENMIFVLGNDGNLWLEEAPFGHLPPTRQQVDSNVRGFYGLTAYEWVWVIRDDATLWLESYPYGTADAVRQQIDSNVLAAQPVDLEQILVLDTSANLWLESAPFGAVPPPNKAQIDGNVMEFAATDASNVLVLGSDGNLWWEKAPFGADVPPARILIDGDVA